MKKTFTKITESMGKPNTCGGGGSPYKNHRFEKLFPFLLLGANIWGGVGPNNVLLGKVHEIPFLPLLPFFGGVKVPSIRKKTVFLVQNFRKIAKKRVNRTKKVGTFY